MYSYGEKTKDKLMKTQYYYYLFIQRTNHRLYTTYIILQFPSFTICQKSMINTDRPIQTIKYIKNKLANTFVIISMYHVIRMIHEK